MTAATVLIPTHQHAEALRHAVAGVQQQNLQDFELFIVGDDVTDATRAVVADLSATDSRIRFFDFSRVRARARFIAIGPCRRRAAVLSHISVTTISGCRAISTSSMRC
jgi:glycosyltransferase involved in cell wall biosynthesis